MSGLIPLFSSLTKKEINRALKRSIALATRKTKTKALDIASSIYNLKKKDLRNKIFVNPKAGTEDAPASKLIFQFKPIGLEKFEPKQTAKGVRVQVFKDGGTQVIDNAFIAKGKRGRGKPLVFVRKAAVTGSALSFIDKMPSGGYRRGARGSELPIIRLREIMGLSTTMEPHANELAKYAGEVGQQELLRQINLLVGR